MGRRIWAGLAVLAALVALGVAELQDEPRRASPVTESEPAAYPTQLATRSGSIVDANGTEVLLRGFNMIGVFDPSSGENWASVHYRRIRRKGFNAVRLVVYWSHLEPSRGRFNRVALRAVDRAIGDARDAGLYVVLDPIHLFDGDRLIPEWARTDGGGPRSSIERNAGGYLKMLASRYRDDPTVAAVDLVNEPPSYPVDQNAILRMYDTLIRIFRTVDRDKILMFQPSYGDSSMANADLGLLTDRRNLVFQMHDSYAGGAGDGYKQTGELNYDFSPENGVFTGGGKSGYTRDSAPEMARHLSVNLREMRAAGIPVFIGEFEIDPDHPTADRWIDDKVALFKRHRLGYTWWLYGTRGGDNSNRYPTLEPDLSFRPFVDRLL